jgi:hypothetical protein
LKLCEEVVTWKRTVDPVSGDGGLVVSDETHSLGARITLERDTNAAPWVITCGIYGLLVHTVFRSDEATARETFDQMKAELERILALPDQGEMIPAVKSFVSSFPT